MKHYFLYSDEQLEEKNKILSKNSKRFMPGTVVVDGVRKKYTQLSTNPSMSRFVDTQLIASGELSTFTYEPPTNISAEGN